MNQQCKPWLMLVLLSFITLPSHVHAAEVHAVASIGYDFGGETLLNYTVTKVNDRPVNREDKITAGQGLTLSLGMYAPIMENVGIQATVGMKIDSTTFVDAYVAFSRIPIDLLAIGHFGEHHSFAGGITYHTGTKFTLESTALNGIDNFDDTVGAIAEYTYAIRNSRDGGLKLGIRYTNINYALTGSTQTLDGSAVGLILYVY